LEAPEVDWPMADIIRPKEREKHALLSLRR
jgi:hypothetical protein